MNTRLLNGEQGKDGEKCGYLCINISYLCFKFLLLMLQVYWCRHEQKSYIALFIRNTAENKDNTMVKTDVGASASISVSLLHTKLISKLNFNK